MTADIFILFKTTVTNKSFFFFAKNIYKKNPVPIHF